MTTEIQLGDVARDRITGFEGVVIATTQWMNQCDRLTIQPRSLHDGKPIESQSFDLPDCELVESQPFAVKPKAERTTGGPRPAPTRRSLP